MKINFLPGLLLVEWLVPAPKPYQIKQRPVWLIRITYLHFGYQLFIAQLVELRLYFHRQIALTKQAYLLLHLCSFTGPRTLEEAMLLYILIPIMGHFIII